MGARGGAVVVLGVGVGLLEGVDCLGKRCVVGKVDTVRGG